MCILLAGALNFIYLYCCNLTHAWQLREYYDVVHRPKINNLATVMGFLVAIKLCLRLMPTGLLYAGLPCSSFVWISSSSTGRSKLNPLGNQECETTRVRNLQSDMYFDKCIRVLLIALGKSTSPGRKFASLSLVLLSVPGNSPARALGGRATWFQQIACVSIFDTNHGTRGLGLHVGSLVPYLLHIGYTSYIYTYVLGEQFVFSGMCVCEVDGFVWPLVPKAFVGNGQRAEFLF